MLNVKQPKMRMETSLPSRRSELAQEIKRHPSWKGEISLSEADQLLKGSKAFTYLIFSGMDDNHFFLSYVNSNQIVKHKNVRIIFAQGQWMVKNGGTGTIYNDITTLIPNCLQCSANVCKPLS